MQMSNGSPPSACLADSGLTTMVLDPGQSDVMQHVIREWHGGVQVPRTLGAFEVWYYGTGDTHSGGRHPLVWIGYPLGM